MVSKVVLLFISVLVGVLADGLLETDSDTCEAIDSGIQLFELNSNTSVLNGIYTFGRASVKGAKGVKMIYEYVTGLWTESFEQGYVRSTIH